MDQIVRPDARKLAIPGEAFVSKASFISGYKYLGYKVDGGALVSDEKARIDSVDESGHEVVFVYKAAGSSGGDGDGDGDGGNNGKCCCRPIIIYNCCKCHEGHKCNIIEKDCCCGE